MGQRREWARMTLDEFLERIHGLKETADHVGSDTRALLDSEFAWGAIWLMLGAMQTSYHVYGAMAQGYPERVSAIGTKKTLELSRGHQDVLDDLLRNQLGSFGKRLALYWFGLRNPEFHGSFGEPEYDIEPGNVEYLVDAMNFLMIEFAHAAHPAANYKPTDSSGSPGRTAVNELLNSPIMRHTNKDIALMDDEFGGIAQALDDSQVTKQGEQK